MFFKLKLSLYKSVILLVIQVKIESLRFWNFPLFCKSSWSCVFYRSGIFICFASRLQVWNPSTLRARSVWVTAGGSHLNQAAVQARTFTQAFLLGLKDNKSILNYFIKNIQLSLLNGITVNGMIRLMGSIFLRYPRPIRP